MFEEEAVVMGRRSSSRRLSEDRPPVLPKSLMGELDVIGRDRRLADEWSRFHAQALRELGAS